MLVFSIGVSVAVLAALALLAVRLKTAHARSDSLDIAAVIGGFVFLASLVAAATPPLLAMLEVMDTSLPSEGWRRAVPFGALAGALIFFATRVLFADVLASLLLWTTRRENEDAQPLGTIVKDRLIHGAVSVCLCAVLFSLLGTRHCMVALARSRDSRRVRFRSIKAKSILGSSIARRGRLTITSCPKSTAWLRETYQGRTNPAFRDTRPRHQPKQRHGNRRHVRPLGRSRWRACSRTWNRMS